MQSSHKFKISTAYTYIYLNRESVMTGGTDRLKILDATYVHRSTCTQEQAQRHPHGTSLITCLVTLHTTLNCIATYHRGQHDFDEA